MGQASCVWGKIQLHIPSRKTEAEPLPGTGWSLLPEAHLKRRHLFPPVTDQSLLDLHLRSFSTPNSKICPHPKGITS